MGRTSVNLVVFVFYFEFIENLTFFTQRKILIINFFYKPFYSFALNSLSFFSFISSIYKQIPCCSPKAFYILPSSRLKTPNPIIVIFYFVISPIFASKHSFPVHLIIFPIANIYSPIRPNLLPSPLIFTFTRFLPFFILLFIFCIILLDLVMRFNLLPRNCLKISIIF